METLDILEQRLQQGNVPVQRMKVKNDESFTLTGKELAAVAAKYPNHPCSIVFKQVADTCLPDEEVTVDRVDLEAALTNRKVKIVPSQSAQFIDGKQQIVVTETKYLEG